MGLFCIVVNCLVLEIHSLSLKLWKTLLFVPVFCFEFKHEFTAYQ